MPSGLLIVGILLSTNVSPSHLHVGDLNACWMSVSFGSLTIAIGYQSSGLTFVSKIDSGFHFIQRRLNIDGGKLYGPMLFALTDTYVVCANNESLPSNISTYKPINDSFTWLTISVFDTDWSCIVNAVSTPLVVSTANLTASSNRRTRSRISIS